jgi:hypothetical protein
MNILSNMTTEDELKQLSELIYGSLGMPKSMFSTSNLKNNLAPPTVFTPQWSGVNMSGVKDIWREDLLNMSMGTPIKMPHALSMEIYLQRSETDWMNLITENVRLHEILKRAVAVFNKTLPSERRMCMVKRMTAADFSKYTAATPSVWTIPDRYKFGYILVQVEANLDLSKSEHLSEVHSLNLKFLPRNDTHNISDLLTMKEIEFTIKGNFIKNFETKKLEEIIIEDVVPVMGGYL